MIRPVFVFLAVGAVWSWGAYVVSSPLILPSPSAVWARWLELQNWGLALSALQSSLKVLVALFFVLVLGVGAGVVLGLNSVLHRAFRPLLRAVQAIPVVSWLGLLIFVLGVGWRAPVFIAVFVFLPTAIFTTVSGVESLERDLLEMAVLYRVPTLKRWRDLYLGALTPSVKAVVDTVAGGAWKTVLVAEYLCGGNGLGVRIAWARQTADVESVYALTLFAVALGLLGEFALRHLGGLLGKRWNLYSE